LTWQPLYPKPGDVLGNYDVTFWEVSSFKTSKLTYKTTLIVQNVPAGIIKFQVSAPPIERLRIVRTLTTS
jgi:hypothetical protein